MKDVAPRIFRTLESAGGRAGFDAIVAAAVAAYGSLRAPTPAQSAEFGRLVTPLWPRTNPETRRTLAASLSHAPRMPAELVDLIVDAPLEIAAPFLVSSPVLTGEQIDRLAARGDARLDRILEGRRGHGLDAARKAGRPLLDAPPLAPEHLVPETKADALDAAAFVRETLRRIAQTDRPQDEAIGTRLLQAARHADSSAFFDVLQACLALANAERDRAEADESGHLLAQILKETGLGAGEALAILMLVRPAIGLNVRAFEEMAATYRSLVAERRRTVLPAAHMPSPAARAAHRRGSGAA